MVHRELVLPAGTTHLRVDVPDAPPRGYAFVMAGLAVVDVSLAPLLPEPLP